MLHLLLLYVGILRSVPSKIGKLIQITNNIFASLPQLTEFILLPLEKSTWNMLPAELLLELLPGDNMANLLEGLGSFPPSSCRSSKIVCGVPHFLILSYRSNFQIVLNCAEPISSFQGMKSLGIGRRGGLLEIA